MNLMRAVQKRRKKKKESAQRNISEGIAAGREASINNKTRFIFSMPFNIVPLDLALHPSQLDKCSTPRYYNNDELKKLCLRTQNHHHAFFLSLSYIILLATQ